MGLSMVAASDKLPVVIKSVTEFHKNDNKTARIVEIHGIRRTA